MCIFVLVGLVMTAGCSEDDDSDEGEWEQVGVSIAWDLNVQVDNYRIDIIHVEAESLDVVTWSVHDEDMLVVDWDDPDGRNVRMQDDLSEINHSSDDYDIAVTKLSGTFYSRNRTGSASRNQTLCVVFMDINADGMMSSGDAIWIRSLDNDGCAGENYRFRLFNERVGDDYGERTLPAT